VGSIALGFIAGALCSLAVLLKYKLGYDDALDVVGVHLVGGVAGALLIGFFGTKATGVGLNGLFYGGGWHLMGLQAEAVGAAVGYSFVATLIIAKVIDLVMGLRITPDQEREGMDLVLHGETAYEMGGTGGGTFTGAHAMPGTVSHASHAPAPTTTGAQA
jgi:ammonium transporter, Amt family